MSVTYTNAQAYVARVLGSETDTTQLAAAADAIKAAIAEWNLRNDWSYLLMDTSGGFTVATCTSDGLNPSTITTAGANGFAGVNPGQTVTGFNITGTVASITSSTVIVLTAQVTGGPVTATFSADIPLVVGTQTYNLPSPIKRPYSARLLTNERTLQFKEQREIDRAYSFQTINATPIFYNLFNSNSWSNAEQNGNVRVFPIPGVADTLRVRFFRPIAEPVSGSDNLDFPNQFVYAFLELARYYFLRDHNAEDVRLAETKERAEMLFREAVASDSEGSEDRDMALLPSTEHGIHRMLDSDDIRWETL